MTEALETIQYLTFTQDDELVVVDGARVQEMLEMPNFNNVPQVPDFMRGVINLRGCEVPVIDLRLRFAVQGTGQADNLGIIVIEVAKAGESVVLGAPAVSAEEVVGVDVSRSEAAPHWLRCRFSKNDIKSISNIFINAAFTAAKPEGDNPWPL